MFSRYELDLFTIYLDGISGRFFYIPGRYEIAWADTEAVLRASSGITEPVIEIEGLVS